MQRPVQNQDLVIALQQDLHIGEAESIALALELGADLVLLDEREGRAQAQRLGLSVIGVLNILLEAKTRALLPQIQPELDALRQIAGFYLSESVYCQILQLAAEM